MGIEERQEFDLVWVQGWQGVQKLRVEPLQELVVRLDVEAGVVSDAPFGDGAEKSDEASHGGVHAFVGPRANRRGQGARVVRCHERYSNPVRKLGRL